MPFDRVRNPDAAIPLTFDTDDDTVTWDPSEFITSTIREVTRAIDQQIEDHLEAHLVEALRAKGYTIEPPPGRTPAYTETTGNPPQTERIHP